MGTSLLTDGPGLSARIRFIKDPPERGSRHRRNTSTPMPPIQWVKLLQISMQWGRASTSERMLAPVVVNPEMVSNNASIGWGMLLLKIKGRAPMRLSTIQLKATVTYPSRV